MSSIISKISNPETRLRKGFWSIGVRGYRIRINYKTVEGTPDVAFVLKKIAIFVHGCYWHRYPYCNLELPKHNTTFWKQKFEINMNQHKEKADHLLRMNWNVITLWECENNSVLDKCVQRINNILMPNKTLNR